MELAKEKRGHLFCPKIIFLTFICVLSQCIVINVIYFQNKHTFTYQKTSLHTVFCLFIYTYLNYANISWASTSKTKWKKLYTQKKHALKIIFNKNKLDSVSYLFNEIKYLNIFKINTFQTLIFMFQNKKPVKSYNFRIKIPKYCTSISYTFFKT